tara:strand:+ start:1287 stop:1709 length:423 start_codon:yes stop_codon:yes gene_type:complete
MRLTGFITINGSREWIDWTIIGEEIVEGPGLSASEITLEGALAPVIAEEETPEDGYEDLTVTELKVQLQQRGEPIYGNKEQLINRLRAWDATNPGGYTPPTIVEEEASATDDASLDGGTTEVVEETTEDEGDEVDGPESE